MFPEVWAGVVNHRTHASKAHSKAELRAHTAVESGPRYICFAYLVHLFRFAYITWCFSLDLSARYPSAKIAGTRASMQVSAHCDVMTRFSF